MESNSDMKSDAKRDKKNAVAGRETNGIEIELDGTEWKSVKVANKKLQVERTEWRVESVECRV